MSNASAAGGAQASNPRIEEEEDSRDGIKQADLKVRRGAILSIINNCKRRKPTAFTNPTHDQRTPCTQVILLGDSAVGKSKLVERFLMDNYHPRQRSTYALTLYRHEEEVDEETQEGGEAGSEPEAGTEPSASDDLSSGGVEVARKRKRKVAVDFWDTAGQERFASMHASYYYRAHACVLVFDVTRKVTYTNLVAWYKELRQFCPNIPCICIANKIDVDYAVTSKAFAFPEKHGLPFFFVSAADGTNVVAIFQEAVRLAWTYKTKGEKDFLNEVLELIDDVSCVA